MVIYKDCTEMHGQQNIKWGNSVCRSACVTSLVVSTRYVYVKVPFKLAFMLCSKPLRYVKTVIAPASWSHYTPYWKRNTTWHTRQQYMPKESHCCLATGSSGIAFCVLCQTVVNNFESLSLQGLTSPVMKETDVQTS